MPYRPDWMISLTQFQDFDHGKTIVERVPPDYADVKAGEIIGWDCAQYYGDARVVSVEKKGGEKFAELVKIS